MITKAELRGQMRERLAALTTAELRSASARVWERLATVPMFAEAGRLLVYVSDGREIDTHGLIQQLLALGRQVCVPLFDERQQGYVVAELREFAELRPGKFGILEPPADPQRRRPLDQTVVALVPGLAFTRRGDRLGRGKGYFDRILAGSSGPRIGLGFAFQVVSRIPAEAHDVRVD